MSLSKSLGAYADIIPILDTVLRHDHYPASFSCGSPREAAHWRLRANGLRAALRRHEETRLDLDRGTGTSIYDSLVFTLDGDCVVILKRESKPAGLLIIDGEPVEVRADDLDEAEGLSPMELADDSDPFDL